MRHLLSFLILVCVFPASAQNQCGLALSDETIDPIVLQRIQKKMSLLAPMISGNSVNAAIAADNLLNEVAQRLSKATPQETPSLATIENPLNTENAIAKQEAYVGKISDLSKVLAGKNSGIFARFKKNSLALKIDEMSQRLSEDTISMTELAQAIQNQIATLRGEQGENAQWEKAVRNEIDFLQEIAQELHAQSSDRGSQFEANVANEVLPRLLQKSNLLMSQNLAIVEMTNSALRTKIQNLQQTLENITQAQTAMLPSVLAAVREKLSQLKSKDAEVTASLTENQKVCLSEEICVGERVAVFKERSYITGYSVEEKSEVLGIDHFGNYNVQNKSKIESLNPNQFARTRKGLSHDGYSVNDKVIYDGTIWRIVGIFPDGELLVNKLSRSFFGFEKSSVFQRVSHYLVSAYKK